MPDRIPEAQPDLSSLGRQSAALALRRALGLSVVP